MSMITPDRLIAACRAYHERYGKAPRYLYVTWFDWDPIHYLLRDSIDAEGYLRVGTWRLMIGLHQEVARGQCVVTDTAIPSEYRPVAKPGEVGRLRATTTVHYPDPQQGAH